MEQRYSFVTWQGSLTGFYLVALQIVSTETVICRIFLFSEVAKFKSVCNENCNAVCKDLAFRG